MTCDRVNCLNEPRDLAEAEYFSNLLASRIREFILMGAIEVLIDVKNLYINNNNRITWYEIMLSTK